MKKYHFVRLICIVFLLMGTLAGTADAWWHKTKSTDATTGKDRHLQPVLGQANDNTFTKLGRGLTNVLEGPFELYAQPVLVSPSTDVVFKIAEGLTRGIAMLVVRELVGVYDIVTFPFPLPKDYKPLIQPETTFTDFDHRVSQRVH